MRPERNHECPTSEKLVAFNRGELSDADLQAVADHLLNCPPCQSSLEGNGDEDTWVSQLRNCAGQPSFISDPECRRLEAQARAIGVGPSDLPTGHYAALTASLADPKAGQRPLTTLGQYQLLEVLGQGGMGMVYKAHQASLNRVVAIKMMRAAFCARPEDYKRFRVEAEAVARLRHPNVIPIYEFSENEGVPYFSMEFLEGGSLGQWISVKGQGKGPRTADLREAVSMVQTVARAVHAAHLQQIIHRDLKPSNVLLTADGMPKVADFGLAKLLDAEAGQTLSDCPISGGFHKSQG